MKILLIEDDRGIGSFIQKGFEQEGHSLDWAERGDDGLMMGLSGEYEAVILDLMLPGMEGLDVLNELRNGGKNFPVLILSAKQTVDDRVTGLKAGGDDYLTKPFAFSELLVRIETLVRRAGSGHESREVTRLSCADLEVELLSRKVVRAGQQIELQPREYALLELFLRNQGNVLTKTLILEKIWNWNFDPQTNVVDVLVSRLRSRIDKEFEPKLIHTVRGAGYVLKEPV
ncbi:MAG: winged helix-turn-helix domain-containing protein [Spirochaetales bacterium]|nr:winged helix-turn-helix domain-containing protein [Spirochaetales bacterium]